MDYKEILKKIRPEFDKAISFLDRELAKIRTGRASPSLVEDVVVDCFGQKFPLKQLSVISCPESRQLVIQPWDKSYLEPIEKALSQTGIGANPIVDKETIRISLPPLTEEYRKSLIHLLAEKEEDARKTVRRWRDEAWKEIQTHFKDGNIREDDKFRAKDELQEMVDEYSGKIAEMGEKKKKEISE